MTFRTSSFRTGLILAALSSATVLAQEFRAAGSFTSSFYDSGNFNRVDLNNNGAPDVVITSFNTLSVMLDPSLTMTSATLTPEITTSTFGSGFFGDIFFADLNNDGHIDIGAAYQGIFSLARFVYVPGDGAGNFGAPVTAFTGSSKSVSVAVGDFNGDSQQDFAAWDYPPQGSPNMTIFTQNNGVYTSVFNQVVGGFPGALSAGDFNGDGIDDMVWVVGGTLSYLLGTSGSFAAPMTMAVSPNLNDGFATDLDHDGLTDFCVQSASSSGWEVDVLWGDRATVLSAPQHVVNMPAPTRSNYLGPFDVDADGNDDLLAVIRNESGFWLLRHDGNRTFSPVPYRTTMAGGLVDLDLDGDLDMISLTSFAGPFNLEENLARYGDACTGAVGVPTLTVGPAIPGTTLELALDNAAPTSLAQIFISLGSNIGVGCGPQIDFGQVLFPSSSVSFLWNATDANGSLSYSLPIPVGVPDVPFFAQGVVLDPQGAFNVAGYGVAASRGHAVRVY